MFTCFRCRFETELDDKVTDGGKYVNGCFCLRCSNREAGTTLVMPKDLRREVEAALADTAGGSYNFLPGVFTCIICHFEAELDDVILNAPSGCCICLRCYCRETATERPMPEALRRQIVAALAGVE